MEINGQVYTIHNNPTTRTEVERLAADGTQASAECQSARDANNAERESTCLVIDTLMGDGAYTSIFGDLIPSVHDCRALLLFVKQQIELATKN